ncbi:receptor-like protein 12 [Tanacetum coccineum]
MLVERGHLQHQGQVIGLDLSKEMISNGIDESRVLFGLKNLESLNLAKSNFNFTKIPTRFGSLASLLYMNLSNSMFSGQIPGELSLLTRLEILDLSEPFFFGIRSLRLKPNLSMLVQNLTRLRGPLDDSLGNVQSLLLIRLASNNLSAPIPDFFANFKNLTVMNLGACNLNGTFPENVLQLQSLQTLDLALNNNLSGSLPDFPINGSLRSLVLSNTNFSGRFQWKNTEIHGKTHSPIVH